MMKIIGKAVLITNQCHFLYFFRTNTVITTKEEACCKYSTAHSIYVWSFSLMNIKKLKSYSPFSLSTSQFLKDWLLLKLVVAFLTKDLMQMQLNKFIVMKPSSSSYEMNQCVQMARKTKLKVLWSWYSFFLGYI